MWLCWRQVSSVLVFEPYVRPTHILSVRIDVDKLLQDRENERLAALAAEEAALSTKKTSDAGLTRKRKSESASEGSSKRKRTTAPTESTEAQTSDATVPAHLPKVTLKVSAKPKDPESEPYPCCLCISRHDSDLLPVHDPPSARSGCSNVPPRHRIENEVEWKEVWKAHEGCAKVVTETWIDEIDVEGEKVKYVFGVDTIVRDRWNLVSIHFCPYSCPCIVSNLHLRNVLRVPRHALRLMAHLSNARRGSARKLSTSPVLRTGLMAHASLY